MIRNLPLSLIAIASLFTTEYVAAQELFKWIDESGRVHFSTEAPHANAKPAELPDITKVKMDPPEILKENCDKHGGIDCDAGPDGDGSVICYDGYQNAAVRYRFTCLTARLSVTDVSFERGLVNVFVRNEKPVKANRVKVRFYRDLESHDLVGPEFIEAHGLGEFKLQLDDAQKPPKKGEVSVDCRNCP